jgi:hypothetical protein
MLWDETFVLTKAVKAVYSFLHYICISRRYDASDWAVFSLACIIPILHNDGMKNRGIGSACSVHMIMIVVTGLWPP